MLCSSSSSVLKETDFEHDCLVKVAKRCAFCETGFKFVRRDSFEFKSDLYDVGDDHFYEKSNELFHHLQETYEKSIQVFEGFYLEKIWILSIEIDDVFLQSQKMSLKRR